MSKEAILSLKGICKDYRQGRSVIEVLKNLSLEIYEGEMLAIIGPSGRGKSTLLHIAGLLDYPDEGKVIIKGVSQHLTDNLKHSSKIRLEKMGFIYQYHHLLRDFSAIENTAMPLIVAGVNKQYAFDKAEFILGNIGLGKRLLNKPGELSGGEQQRVAVARAVINDPIIILADEPTGNLDVANADEVFNILLEQARSNKAAIAMVSHNMELAAKMHRIYKL